jgi:hypothetical protein
MGLHGLDQGYIYFYLFFTMLFTIIYKIGYVPEVYISTTNLNDDYMQSKRVVQVYTWYKEGKVIRVLN